MKPLKFSPDVNKKIREFQRRDLKLYKKIQKQLELFLKDSRHPSLRLHKIRRKDRLKIWSISITQEYRMLYEENDHLYFVDIGTHDEVYRKK